MPGLSAAKTPYAFTPYASRLFSSEAPKVTQGMAGPARQSAPGLPGWISSVRHLTRSQVRYRARAAIWPAR